MVTQKTTYAQEAKDNLIEQFKKKTNFEDLLDVFSGQVQELETVLFQLILERFIEDAVGIQLDRLGQIPGEDREGRDDDLYRIAIKRKIVLNRSSGLAEEVLALVKSIVGSQTIELTLPGDPAHFEVFLPDIFPPSIALGAQVSSVIQDAKAGGVRAIFIWHEAEPAFGFLTTPSALGFTAGKFASALDR